MNLYDNTLLSEEVRLETFQTWPIPHIVPPRDLARSGFYYLNENNTAICIYCDGQITNWQSNDEPDRKHKKLFPNCTFVQDVIIDRLREGDVDLHPGICFDGEIQTALYINLNGKPHNTDYASLEARLASFNMWPKSSPQKPEKLAEAGFFYMGFVDVVECFSCGTCFRDWEPEDDPWVEHAKKPECRYLLTRKGQDFVNRCLNVDFSNNGIIDSFVNVSA